MLVFDEVKTGLTAGYAGAAQRLGVQPDLITLAKSIGGGLPLAAFGGKREVMEVVVDGRMAHFGTYNGNPLVMAAARAVDEICTHEALDAVEAINERAMTAIDEVIAEYELPAHTVGLGVKGCVTWSTTPVRNYRDYKATDFASGRAVVAVGRQPQHPHPARARRAVAGLARAHRRRHGSAGRRLHRAGQGPARLRWDARVALDDYDGTQIGSGIGGLTAASLLARLADTRVLVRSGARPDRSPARRPPGTTGARPGTPAQLSSPAPRQLRRVGGAGRCQSGRPLDRCDLDH